MANTILDNGALVTLGLVAAVAAVGAANKAGLYGSTGSAARGKVTMRPLADYIPGKYRGRVIGDASYVESHNLDRREIEEIKLHLEENGFTVRVETSDADLHGKMREGVRDTFGHRTVIRAMPVRPSDSGTTGSAARGFSFGWAQVKGGHVVKVSNAERKPTGTGWGEINTVNTKIGDRAHLDGGMVYLKGGSLNEGSAARGVTEGYVESYLDGDNIAISTFLNRHLRGRAKQFAGQYARRLKAALDAMVVSGEAYRATTPNGAPSYRRTSSDSGTAGSAARGVTEGYVESYLDGDNIAISTFLNRHLRGKAKQFAGQYARRLKAALDALVVSGEAYRATTPNGAPSYRRTSSDSGTAGSAARATRTRLRTLPFTFVNATAEESKGMFHPPQVIRIGKKRIVTPAGSGDDVDAYVYGDNVLVVVSNSRMPYYGATLYTDDEQGGYRVDQDVFLQGQEEVVDALGKRYDSLRDLTIANKLLAAMS
jgi:uncharacterized protein YegP (UPF0339 family)